MSAASTWFVSATALAKRSATLKLSIAGIVVKTGTLRVYDNGHLIKAVTLKNFKATVKLPTKAKKIVVKYAGSKLVAAATLTRKR